MTKRVVITGAAGNLGRKLRDWLSERGGYELVLIDRESGGDPAVVAADVGVYDAAWADLVRSSDVVVHLAGAIWPYTYSDALMAGNVDAVLNLFEAAVNGTVKRVILASSTHVMVGYRGSRCQITADMPPRPLSAYGMSKLMGERIGQSYAQRHGLSVVCLRIGTVRPGANPPHKRVSHWDQQRWLSNRDFCQAVERAINVEGVDFTVLNLISDIPGSRWNIDETRRVLGYVPQDRDVPTRGTLRAELRAWLSGKRPDLVRWLRGF